MNRFPLMTALLAILTGCLALLPNTLHEYLYYDYLRLMEGRWFGLVSGHWIHADTDHLLWNLTAFAIITASIEMYSRRLLVWSLVVGMISVDILLISPLSDISRYCGLSGVLNTLLGVMLFVLWRRTRANLVIVVGLLCLLKIIIELQLNQSIFTSLSWPPYALAHLAGIVATPVALLLGYSDTDKNAAIKNNTRDNYEYLVTSQ